jgi:hypothetical protein
MVAVLAGSALAAHAQTPPGFHRVGMTSRVSLFVRAGRASDRRDLKRTDAFLARMESELAQPLDAPLDYFRYERPEDIAAQTGVYAYGLTSLGSDVIHSTASFQPHELVHAVAGRLGNPGRFFHEGLAVVLGDEGRWEGRDVDDVLRGRVRNLRLERLTSDFDALPADLAYSAAGSFVRRLVQARGQAALLEFFRAARTPSQASGAFIRVYGRSLASELEAWRTELDREVRTASIQEGGLR